ncbi:histone acetyltransferase subunit NuA4-domain-containing protein [Phlyctochytrium arcticum]|nr:histone acetyltransferase subunit NuA4-domain-containing protein [Phlyctochytrium arcticum]
MLQEAERELSELLGRKKAVDKQLMDLERKIYLLEGTYLEDTSQYGNIIKGFEGYLHTSSTKKKQKLSEEDRLFSRSSVTYPKALEMNQRSRDEMDDIADPEPSSATYASTPIAAPSSSSRSDRTKKSTLKKRKSSVVGEMDSPTPTQRRKKIKIPDGDD